MKQRNFKSSFKLKVVLEALSERYTIQELSRKYQIHPTQITNWKTQFLKHGESVFEKSVKSEKSEAQQQEERLLTTIDQF